MSDSSELNEIRSLAREFARAELRPNLERWEAERTIDGDVITKLGELGFFGMLVPEANGGMGFDQMTYAAAIEELAWGEPAVALLVAHSTIAADVLLRYGGGSHAKAIEAMAGGRAIGCIGLAESEDPTRAVRAARTAGGWTFTGHVPWVANGLDANFAVVFGRVDGEAALFAIPRSAGFLPGARVDTMGLRALSVIELDMNEATAMLDERLKWNGTDPVTAIDPLAALSIAAISVGISQAALEHAVQYAGQREQFGRPIRTFDGVRFKLADIATRTAAARALVEHAAARPGDGMAAAMARLTAAPCAMFAATEAVQVFGGYGYMRDYPAEKLMRDAKAMEMLHGTTETQRVRIADALYAE